MGVSEEHHQFIMYRYFFFGMMMKSDALVLHLLAPPMSHTQSDCMPSRQQETLQEAAIFAIFSHEISRAHQSSARVARDGQLSSPPPN